MTYHCLQKYMYVVSFLTHRIISLIENSILDISLLIISVWNIRQLLIGDMIECKNKKKYKCTTYVLYQTGLFLGKKDRIITFLQYRQNTLIIRCRHLFRSNASFLYKVRKRH